MTSVTIDREKRMTEIQELEKPNEVWDEEITEVTDNEREEIIEVVHHTGEYGSDKHMKNNVGRDEVRFNDK